MSDSDNLPGGMESPEKVDRRKRVRTPEEKLEMLANLSKAREAKSGKTRGRPAFREMTERLPKVRAPEITGDMSPEQMLDAIGSGEGLTRESRVGITAAFDIPERGRREGWDYQWWPTHYVGEEVDPSYQVEIARGSWFPVPASHFPQLCPPGWKRPTIDREGMRLYMRPMRLTEEARNEAAQMAYRQKMDRLAAAQAGDAGRDMARRVGGDRWGDAGIRVEGDTKPLI